MIAEVGADITDSESTIGRRTRRVGVVFVEESHLHGTQKAVLGRDILTLLKFISDQFLDPLSTVSPLAVSYTLGHSPGRALVDRACCGEDEWT